MKLPFRFARRLRPVAVALLAAMVATGCAEELELVEQFLLELQRAVEASSGESAGENSDSDHVRLGNPSDAIADPASADNYLIETPDYVLSYSQSRGTANWASWKLDQSWLGSAERQDDFRANETLPPGWYQVDGNDYKGSGYDRGHLVPSGDRTKSQAINSNTFLMTNIIPQAPDNNRETWRRMEEYCRQLVDRGYELYIVAGVYGGSKKIAEGQVTVPQQTWKVAIAVQSGQDPTAVTPNQAIVFAVDIPNNNRLSNNWRRYQLPIDELETRTGMDFFEVLPDGLENVIEAQAIEAPRF